MVLIVYILQYYHGARFRVDEMEYHYMLITQSELSIRFRAVAKTQWDACTLGFVDGLGCSSASIYRASFPVEGAQDLPPLFHISHKVPSKPQNSLQTAHIVVKMSSHTITLGLCLERELQKSRSRKAWRDPGRDARGEDEQIARKVDARKQNERGVDDKHQPPEQWPSKERKQQGRQTNRALAVAESLGA